MEFTFLHSDPIDYYQWFIKTIQEIYNINFPEKSDDLNGFQTEHIIQHAWCGAEFTNWNEDPMLNDSCEGQVLVFKHADNDFYIKLRVKSGHGALGNLDSGIFKINDKDPFYEPWVKALEIIIPKLKLEKKDLYHCTDGCKILDKYWND